MRLKELLSLLPVYQSEGNVDIEIEAIVADSRKVTTGCLFVALVGHNVDGHRFCAEAVARGAAAILVEQDRTEARVDGVTRIEVSDTRRTLAILVDAFYSHPSHALHVIGITGTNGKTTTTQLIRNILEDQGYKTGLIGTISTIIGDQVINSKNTTPESLELHDSLGQMVTAGCTHAVMEVSSHSLVQGRVNGVHFSTTVFTNLTQDHLDYHHSMDEYKHAKGLLFAQMGNTYSTKYRPAILNADDPASTYFRRITASPVITYGIDNAADVRASKLVISDRRIRFWLDTWLGSQEVVLQLTGKFNVYNSLAAIAVTLTNGIPLAAIVASLSKVHGVDGRMQRVEAGQKFTVLVDYAHTPDSLENVLSTIRQFAQGKVIAIVGCGGDRDRSKRPLMARIAASISDHAIYTSDNPRHEDPNTIIRDMLNGLTTNETSYTNYEVVIDRKSAIEAAIAQVQANDVILIAGKGHETYQDFGDRIIHFDDREIALEAIRRYSNA